MSRLDHFDGLRRGADHGDVELVEHAHAIERKRRVQRSLSAHRRQQREYALVSGLAQHLALVLDITRCQLLPEGE